MAGSFMTLEKPASTILSIQYLRALAALLVVFAHAHDQLRVALPYNPKLGHIGVDIFFVISGFIMVVISERREPTALGFLFDRIRRIVPNYWFYTTVVAILAIAAPKLFRDTSFDLSHFVQSLLFIVHERPGDPDATSPLLRLGWTLNYEMFFYAIFAISIALSFRLRIALTAGAICGLVILGKVLDGGAVWHFYTGTIMLEFVAGMLIGAFFVTRGAPPARLGPLFWIATLAALLWAEMVMWDQATRGIVYGIPAAIVVFLALSIRATGQGLVGRTLKNLGDASYTIYLFHLFPLAALRIAWNMAGLPKTLAANFAFVALALIVVSITGLIAYRLIEQPFSRLAKGLFAKKAVASLANG
jgi:exopolysaccharide production protein ExoZ